MSIRVLEPQFVERVWGTTRLGPLFPDQAAKIGEVWFDAGPAFPLLTKFIYTSEKLSVQVHPNDSYARTVENSRGKTEMWHILSAEPGATIALGFRRAVGETELRSAIAAGRVEDLLNVIPVAPGETYFVEAGVVHAIGAGIALCEIQQNSDVTYRLYDYNRGRELHLEKGLAVAYLEPYQGQKDFPVSCAHFVTDRMEVAKALALSADKTSGVLIVLEGSGQVDESEVRGGQVCLIPPKSPDIRILPYSPMRLLYARPRVGNLTEP